MSRQPWVENLLRPLVLTTMVGCIALSLADLQRLVIPTWNSALLLAGCVLAALEAHYAYRLIRAHRGLNVWRFRAIEYGFFFIVLKFGSYTGGGWRAMWVDAQSWPREPARIFDPETSIAFLFAVLVSLVITDTLQDLERLGEPPDRERGYIPPTESLASRFFWGGAALLFVAGLARVGIAAVLNLSRPSAPGLVLNVLVYFMLGLAMLGQVHFAALNLRWQAQGIRVGDELAGRWVRYTLVFLGLAALLAFSLPTGYTLGFPGRLVEILCAVVTFFWLVLYVLILPLLWLFSLLLGRARPLPPVNPPPLLPSPQHVTPGPPWWEFIRSLLFWAIVLGMILYVLASYLRERSGLLRALSAWRPVRALRRLWAALRRHASGLAEAINNRVPRHWLRRWLQRPLSQQPFRFPLRGLGVASPREKILYYYLSLVRRAGQLGFPRRQAQTPFEYNKIFASHLPEAHADMDLLTEAFVEARYSPHAAEPAHAGRVRAAWHRVRAALKTIKGR